MAEQQRLEHVRSLNEQRKEAVPLYLDHNGTTPVPPTVLEKMLPFLADHFGSINTPYFGREPKRALDEAREHVSRLIRANEPGEIVFASNGTETINHTLFGLAKNAKNKGHVITQVTEHVAVLETCQGLRDLGVRYGTGTGWLIRGSDRFPPPVSRIGVRPVSDLRRSPCHNVSPPWSCRVMSPMSYVRYTTVACRICGEVSFRICIRLHESNLKVGFHKEAVR